MTRFKKPNHPSRTMGKEGDDSTSGISKLSDVELKKYEGKFVGIVDGKVKFADTDASKVLNWVINNTSSNKVFSSIPKSSASLVK